MSGAQCSGIQVSASSNVRIRSNQTNGSVFNGIAVNDATRVVVHGNSASDNCLGIGVVDAEDGGYGVRAEDFPGDIVRISSNVTNGNNKSCPFGPPEAGLLLGGTGIVAGGMDNLTVKNNTANDNVVAGSTITASGIIVADFPNEDGTFNPTNLVRITGNTVTGNSSADGPVDLTIAASGPKVSVAANTCGVSVPDPTWCGG